MNDMRPVLAPKSDQINADELAGGPVTITIREVRISAGQEQPVSIYFEGSDKAFRPCKTMGRALMEMWGPDASKYIGHSLTLYRDPSVKFGKDAVGGVRISHATGITERKVMMLTATRGQRKPFAIMPLEMAPSNDTVSPNVLTIDRARSDIEAAADLDELKSIWTRKSMAPHRTELQADLDKRKAELSDTVSVDAPNAEEGRADQDMGEPAQEDAPF